MGKLYLRVTYLLKAGSAELFLREINESNILPVIRKEDGCIEYSYYIPVAAPDALMLFEAWESEESQQKHLKQPHMEILKALKERYVTKTMVEKFSPRVD